MSGRKGAQKNNQGAGDSLLVEEGSLVSLSPLLLENSHLRAFWVLDNGCFDIRELRADQRAAFQSVLETAQLRYRGELDDVAQTQIVHSVHNNHIAFRHREESALDVDCRIQVPCS
ncbi:hypothetical protein AYI70_g10335 [Smittium culicis]|uniref:Uncharacterized protein n=1 Tax=Smittium culicis TaxID=133412 RepID=A0A1R1X744_9FUNG|nr:hypothetical protein AYI70_g10335 [Smittium culicis]